MNGNKRRVQLLVSDRPKFPVTILDFIIDRYSPFFEIILHEKFLLIKDSENNTLRLFDIWTHEAPLLEIGSTDKNSLMISSVSMEIGSICLTVLGSTSI